MAVPTPKHPSHTVRHVDNWDGERNIVTSLAFIHEGDFRYYDSGKPLMEYVGDEVLHVWELTHENAQKLRQD